MRPRTEQPGTDRPLSLVFDDVSANQGPMRGTHSHHDSEEQVMALLKSPPWQLMLPSWPMMLPTHVTSRVAPPATEIGHRRFVRGSLGGGA